MADNKEPKGLGGWLMLVGLLVVIAPIRLIVTYVPIYKTIFEDGTWEALTTAGSETYHAFWAPLLMGEIAYNAIILAVSLYLIYMFLAKHYLFPKVFIAVLSVSLIAIPVDAWLVTKILPDEPMFDPATRREFLKAFIDCLVLIPYLLVSKRVRATFIDNRPANEESPNAAGSG